MDRLTNVGTNGEIWITDNDKTRRYGRKDCAYQKLKDYEDLEETNQLVRLPCKVGDTAWYVHDGEIDEVTVDSFIFTMAL